MQRASYTGINYAIWHNIAISLENLAGIDIFLRSAFVKNLAVQSVFISEFFGNYGVSLIFYMHVNAAATAITALNETVRGNRRSAARIRLYRALIYLFALKNSRRFTKRIVS